MGSPRRSAALAAQAVTGGLSTLAAAPLGQLVTDKNLRRLLACVCRETQETRVEALAVRLCQESPNKKHPWLRALRRGRPFGAQKVLGPWKASPRMAMIAAVLDRLEKKS